MSIWVLTGSSKSSWTELYIEEIRYASFGIVLSKGIWVCAALITGLRRMANDGFRRLIPRTLTPLHCASGLDERQDDYIDV